VAVISFAITVASDESAVIVKLGTNTLFASLAVTTTAGVLAMSARDGVAPPVPNGAPAADAIV
jgi:hypothetical protein